jgi:[ribosomal protein S18]-alanine N-acetyltransferase
MIRLACAKDIPAMIRLERACPMAAHWSEERYRQMFEASAAGAGRLAWVVEKSNAAADSSVGAQGASQLAGFLVSRQIAGEWELENIVVAADFRRQGLGQRLLNALIAHAHETNSESVFLEVRESNAAARALYEKAGFQATGRRKSYYQSPLEDALLYQRIVKS